MQKTSVSHVVGICSVSRYYGQSCDVHVKEMSPVCSNGEILSGFLTAPAAAHAQVTQRHARVRLLIQKKAGQVVKH